MMARSTPDYHVVMVDDGKQRCEANVSSHSLWSDALDAVHEAACGGHTIEFVHHIHDGVVDDRTREALNAAWIFLTLLGSPVTEKQKSFLRVHFGADVANAFEPQAGFYRLSRKSGQSQPVAYWFTEDGVLRCRIGNADVDEQIANERWPWASKWPITHEVYKSVMDGNP
jgi:hypothetical protein